MTSGQIILLFLGLPLAILGMGLRRALGAKGLLVLLIAGTLVAAYSLLLEAILRSAGHGLPLPGVRTDGLLRGFGAFSLGAALLGGLGAVLLRFRGHGSRE